jgi:uncharacterized repeat protein (TIGR01451 family)
LRWLSAVLICCLLQGFAAAQSFPVTQNFSDTTATTSGWTLGDSAILTGNGTADPIGSGWLRLSNANNNQKGYAVYNTSFPTPQGVSIEFEYKTWGGSGADGFTIFLFDGNATGAFNIGDSGGSLGYANGCGGVAGAYRGYVGLSFDEFGNFSNPADRCKTGGPGAQPQQVAIRGPWDYKPTAGSNGYEYLTSTGTLTGNTIGYTTATTTRPSDTTFFRKVLILVEPIPASSLYRLTVKWQTAVGGTYSTLINAYTMPTAPPSNLKIGFAASTGGSTNYHEIRNLSIQKPTNLSVVKTLSGGLTSPLNPLTNISYTLLATNAGPNIVSDAILTDSISSLIENAAFTCLAGTGSSCSSSGGPLTSNNLNITLGLPVGGSATVTVTGRLKANAATRTIPNTALISLPATSQFNDLNPNDDSSTISTLINGFQISGLAFRDANTNAFYDPGLEPLLTTSYLPSLTGTDDLGNSIVRTATMDVTAGNYVFANLPVGNYVISGVNRSGQTPGEVFTTPPTLAVSLVSANITRQWFGYFQGRKVTGTVFNDDGRSSTNGTTLTNANNALQEAGESGTQNISVTASGNLSSGGAAVQIQSKTDLQGMYTLWIPSTWTGAATIAHSSSVPTGTNQSGTGIVTAVGFESTAARTFVLAGQVSGTVYDGFNFGLVPRSLLQPDQFGSTSSPGSVRYLHFFRPGTPGTLTLSSTSSAGFRYIYYRDLNCDGTVDVSEHASPMTGTTVVVDALWPRETSGKLKACGLEVEVLAPAGKATTVVDLATITAGLQWIGNANVTDASRVIDTTRLSGIAGNLQLFKGVRNVTVDTLTGITVPTYKTSVAGKPGVAGSIGEELEYCINYQNVGTTAVANMVMTDPIPFFTNFKPGTITWNGTTQSDGTTLITNIVTVNVGTVLAGASGKVCYRVTIK